MPLAGLCKRGCPGGYGGSVNRHMSRGVPRSPTSCQVNRLPTVRTDRRTPSRQAHPVSEVHRGYAGCMITATERISVTLTIAENMYCSPLYRKIRELLDRSAIGRAVPVQRARESRTSGREHSFARWSHRHQLVRVPLTSKQMGTKQRPEARIRPKP